MIDGLELGEDDPERLASLFQMDHLATRMRRNSDSALVLAGHQTSGGRTEPVTLVDVLRAAVSEIEQYDRVILDVQQRCLGQRERRGRHRAPARRAAGERHHVLAQGDPGHQCPAHSRAAAAR